MYTTPQKLNHNAHKSEFMFEPFVAENKNEQIDQNDDMNIFSMQDSAEVRADEQALRDAFLQEAVPHISLLHNYALKLMGNKLDADDLLQDTYLRAFRFFNTYERGTNCKAWLFRIMKNLYINRYRKDQKEAAKVDYGLIENYFDTVKSLEMDSNDLQAKIFSMLLDDEITGALESIKDDFKVVVILCDLEGFSYEEIADFLHCPIGTVRSRLHRGRRLLQKKLAYMRK